MAARRAAWPLVAGLLLALAPVRSPAGPLATLAAGSTMGANGQPGTGGAVVEASVLWPVDNRFAFGGVVFADDLGTALTELSDPNTGEPLGTVADQHRWSYGIGWRAAARLGDWKRWRAHWGADFGWGRQETDVRGEVVDAVSGVQFATGPTLLWNAAAKHAVGVTVAWKHAFVSREADPGRTTDWAALALVWRWHGAPSQ